MSNTGDTLFGGIDPATSRLNMTTYFGGQRRAVLLKGVSLQKFQATFALRRDPTSGAYAVVNFLFDGQDDRNWDGLVLSHITSNHPPQSWCASNLNFSSSAASSLSANMPTPGATDVLWYRIENDGSQVKVWALAQSEAAEGRLTRLPTPTLARNAKQSCGKASPCRSSRRPSTRSLNIPSQIATHPKNHKKIKNFLFFPSFFTSFGFL